MFKITTGDSEGRATHWFAMFMAQITFIQEDEYNIQCYADRLGIKVNFKELNNIGDDIVFESEEEFLIFKLRFC